MGWIAPIYVRAKVSSPLHSSVAAISLGTLCGYNRQELYAESVYKYGQALKEVQAAINDPERALWDDTIAAVILLITYTVSRALHVLNEFRSKKSDQDVEKQPPNNIADLCLDGNW